MAVTWAMIDPLMTVLRPVAAFLTACVAGLAANLLPERALAQPASPAAQTISGGGCGCGGACSTASSTDSSVDSSGPGVLTRLRSGVGDAFGEMLADVGGWLLVGILVAGAISLLLPPDFFQDLPGGEFSSMLAMLLVGVPLYVCASSSTPIAASLLLKGLSPGAALVFLLTGPATNVTTLTVMARSFGAAFTGVYLAAIALCALAFGFVANRVYAALGFDLHAVLGQVHEALPAWLGAASAVLLLGLVARALALHRHAR
jgi:uncharacterized membrane protein YraQ (UPF0718 family)